MRSRDPLRLFYVVFRRCWSALCWPLVVVCINLSRGRHSNRLALACLLLVINLPAISSGSHRLRCRRTGDTLAALLSNQDGRAVHCNPLPLHSCPSDSRGAGRNVVAAASVVTNFLVSVMAVEVHVRADLYGRRCCHDRRCRYVVTAAPAYLICASTSNGADSQTEAVSQRAAGHRLRPRSFRGCSRAADNLVAS